MALREEMVSNGNFLFRWRSLLPLALVIFFIPAILTYHYLADTKAIEFYWQLFCLLVSVSGLLVRVLTIGFVPRKTSGRNRKTQVAETLNTTGIYSVVRNPLYLGNYLMILGQVLFVHSIWLPLVYTLAFWLYYERIILAEEDFLRQKFKKPYLDWAAKTPAFIPRLAQYQKNELSFSLRNVLKREYPGLFAMLLVFGFLNVVTNYMASGNWQLDLFWQVAVGFGLLTWITLHMLRKFTKVLNVPGR